MRVCYFCTASLCGLTEKRLQAARWHTEAALPALKETTDTPEVHWLAILRSFVCLFCFWRLHSNFSGEELGTQNRLLYCEPRGRSCLNHVDGRQDEVLMRQGRRAGRPAASTFFLRHTMFIKPWNGQRSQGRVRLSD